MLSRSCSIILLAALTLAACNRPASTPTVAEPAPSRSFHVQGFLRAIDFANSSATVEHEDIPGFMPSMTMPFDVKAMAEVEPLKAGDAIGFTLVVTDKASWIEGIKKVDPSEVHLPKAKTGSAEPSASVARLKEGDRMPEFSLVDSKGRHITRESFPGRPLLLTFIFTRCPLPNFCPLMSNNFREVQKALADAGEEQENLQFLSISFDPEFDTPDKLAAYAGTYTQDTDRWRFASGTAEETKRLTQAFAVTVQPEAGTINHGLATALVGSDGVIRSIWRGNGWKPADVLAALHASK